MVWGLRLVTWTIDVTRTDRLQVWGLRLVTWTIDVTLTGRKFEGCAWLHELLMLHTLTGQKFEACAWLHELLMLHTWQAGSLRSAPGYMNYWCYTDRPEVWGLRLVTWTIDVTLTGRKFEACAWLHELLILHWQAGSLTSAVGYINYWSYTLTDRRFEACGWLHELLSWHTLTSWMFEHWAWLHGLRIKKTSCYTSRLVQGLVTWTVVKKVNKKSTARKPFCTGRWFAPGNVNCG